MTAQVDPYLINDPSGHTFGKMHGQKNKQREMEEEKEAVKSYKKMTISSPPGVQKKQISISKGTAITTAQHAPKSTALSSDGAMTTQAASRTTSDPNSVTGNPNRRTRYTPRTVRRASNPPPSKTYTTLASAEAQQQHTAVPERQYVPRDQRGVDRERDHRDMHRTAYNKSPDSAGRQSSVERDRDGDGYAAPRRVARGYEDGASTGTRQPSSRHAGERGMRDSQVSIKQSEWATSRQTDRAPPVRVGSRQADRERGSGHEQSEGRVCSRQIQRNERSASRQERDTSERDRSSHRISSARAPLAEGKDDTTTQNTRERERYEAYYNKDGSRTPKALRRKKSTSQCTAMGTITDEPEAPRGLREITDRSAIRRSNSRNRRSASPGRVGVNGTKASQEMRASDGRASDGRDISRQESRVTVSRQAESRQSVSRQTERGRESKASEESYRNGRRRESSTQVIYSEEGRRNVFIAWSGSRYAQVEVIGSWDQWRRPIPLVWDFDQHYAVIDLRCGEYEYKFIVDGLHTYDKSKPVRDDWSGSYNNYFTI